jgi:hypothetical protein
MGRLAVAQAEAERMAAALAAKEHATVNLEDAFVEVSLLSAACTTCVRACVRACVHASV